MTLVMRDTDMVGTSEMMPCQLQFAGHAQSPIRTTSLLPETQAV